MRYTQEDVTIFQELSDQEFNVLYLMTNNKSNDEIAKELLFVTPGRVRQIISSIYKKLGLSMEKKTVKRSKAIAMFPKILEYREAKSQK